jgi:hypothetical protein
MAEEEKAKEVGQEFAKFLNDKATVKDGQANLTLSDLKSFYKAKGITESSLDQFSGVQKEIETGLYRYSQDKVIEKVKELKKAGKDEEAKNAKFETRMNIPNGVQSFTATASRVSQNPQDRTKSVTKYGVYREVIKVTRAIDKDVLVTYQDRLMKELSD